MARAGSKMKGKGMTLIFKTPRGGKKKSSRMGAKRAVRRSKARRY